MAFLPHERIETTQALLDMIELDGLGPGERLPGENALCTRLGFSRHRMRLGLQALEEDGVLERRGRSGTYLRRQPERSALTPARSEQNRRLITLVLLRPELQADVTSLHEHAASRGFLLHSYFSLLHGHRAEDEREYLESAAASGFAGAILHPTPRGPSNDPLFRKLDERMRLAHIDFHSRALPEQSFFLPDFEQAGMLAAARLLGQGCRRLVAVSCLPPKHHVTEMLADGLDRAASVAGVAPVGRIAGAHGLTQGMKSLRRLLRDATPDTGILLYGPDALHLAATDGTQARVIGVTDHQMGELTALGLDLLVFDWVQRLRDALDYIMSGTQSRQHRLYPPSLTTAES